MLELLFLNLQQQKHLTLSTTNKNITFESLFKISISNHSNTVEHAHNASFQKYFSHPHLVIYFFATSPLKLKCGQQIGGGDLLIENHID